MRWLDGQQAREYEPHLSARAALHVPDTGIVDFSQVCRTLADLVTKAGGTVQLGAEVIGIRPDRARTHRVLTTAGDLPADLVINCAGLYADRVARLAGAQPQVRIVPFRGEYYVLRPDRAALVQGLIYPVPDPRLPFLGVHLTRMIDDSVHAGPNAGWPPRAIGNAGSTPGWPRSSAGREPGGWPAGTGAPA